MDDQGGGASDSRVDQLERRIGSLEERTSMLDRSRAMAGQIVPPETRRHLRAAGRENLLAVRSLLDYWIARLRDDDQRAEPVDTRESIRVD